MGCVFGRASPRNKERASPKPAPPTKGSASIAVDGENSPGRPRRRLGRRVGPRQGRVPAPAAAAEQLAAGWPPWLVAVAGEALQGWMPRRADTFEKLNKVLYAGCSPLPKPVKFDVYVTHRVLILLLYLVVVVVLILFFFQPLDRFGHLQQRLPGEGHCLRTHSGAKEGPLRQPGARERQVHG